MSSASLRADVFGVLKSFSKLLIPRRLRARLRRYYWTVGGLVRWRWSQLCALAMAARFRRMPQRAGRRLKSGGRPHTLPGPLIVSITSYRGHSVGCYLNNAKAEHSANLEREVTVVNSCQFV